MYRETLKFSALDEATANTSAVSGSAPVLEKPKVNRICDAFLQALEGLRKSHLQNIITAHVCKTPPDLDAGLSVIGQLRGDLPLCPLLTCSSDESL